MKTYEHFIFRMTVYNFYILGKNGQSIFYHEWERPQKASLSRSEEDKLMAGLIFSLSNFARKMTKVSFFLSGQFLPEVSQDWDQVLTNGFLYRVPNSL